MKHTIVVQVDAKGRPISAESGLAGGGGPGARGQSDLAKETGTAVQKSLAGRAMMNLVSNIVSGGTLGSAASAGAGMLKQAGMARMAAGAKGGPAMIAGAELIEVGKKLWGEWKGIAKQGALSSTENLAATYAAYNVPVDDKALDQYYDRQYEIQLRQLKARQRIRRKYFTSNPVDANLFSAGMDLIRGE